MVAPKVNKIGKYQVLDVIGRGGMGMVYKAVDPTIGRSVAIKTITGAFSDDPLLLKRFYREAYSTGKLQHVNIVTVYDLGDQDGTPYLVMEYLEGESLEKVIKERRPYTVAEKLNIIIQVCEGLGYAHLHDIIHRDVKPGNVVVQKDGIVKIVDFGIAQLGNERFTRTGQVIGSLYYMSPEQIQGLDIDARSDIYSTGVLLFELLAGELPFQGRDATSTLAKILQELPPSLATFLNPCPPELDRVVQRALSKDRNLRYTSMEDFAYDLQSLQQNLIRDLIASYLVSAESSLAKNDWDKAREPLRQVLKFDKQHRRANELLREVQTQIQKQQISEHVGQLQSQAKDALSARRWDEAISFLDQAIRLDGNNSELIEFRNAVRRTSTQLAEALRRAELAHEEGDLDAAKRAVEEALKVDPSDTTAKALNTILSKEIAEHSKRKKIDDLVAEARKEIALRHYTAALDLLRGAEEVDASVAEVHRLMHTATTGREHERRRRALEETCSEIEDLLNRDEYAAACSKADRALQQFPEDLGLLKLRSFAEKQREAWTRRLFIDAQIKTARQLVNADQLTRAQAVLNEALERYPEDPGLFSLLATVTDSIAQQQAQLREAERQVAEKRRYINLQISSAAELQRSGQTAQALKKLQDALRHYPDSQELRGQIGVVEHLLAREEDDRKRIEQEIQRKRTEIEQEIAAARQLLGAKQTSHAATALEQALRRHPESKELKSELDFARRRWAAEEAERERIEQDARRQRAQIVQEIVKARALLDSKQPSKAVAGLEQALQQYPESQELISQLQFARDRLSVEQAERELLEQEKRQKQAAIQQQLALASQLLDSNQAGRALSVLEQAFRRHPDSENLKSQLAFVRRRVATEQAQREAAELEARLKQEEIEREIATATQLLEAKQINQAMLTLQQAVGRFPQNKELQSQLELAKQRFAKEVEEKQRAEQQTRRERAEIAAEIAASQELLDRRQTSRAVESLEKALHRFPQRLELRAQLELASRQLSREKEERVRAEQEAARRSKEIETQISAARRSLESNLTGDAVNAIAQAARNFPESTELRSLLTAAQEKQKKEQVEREKRSREAQARSERIAAGIQNAKNLLKANQTLEACDLLEEILQRHPESQDLSSLLAVSKEKLAREQAEREQIEERRSRLQAETVRAQNLINTGRPDEAVKVVEAALRELGEDLQLQRLLQSATAAVKQKKAEDRKRAAEMRQADDQRRRRDRDLAALNRIADSASAGAKAAALRKLERQAQQLSGAYPSDPKFQEAFAAVRKAMEAVVDGQSEHSPENVRTALAIKMSASISEDARGATGVIGETVSPQEQSTPALESEATRRGRFGKWTLVAAIGVVIAGAIVVKVVSSRKTYSVSIETEPAGAQVRIGTQTCFTPNCRVSLPAGNYQLEAQLQGYEPRSQALLIDSKHSEAKISLVPRAPLVPPANGNFLVVKTGVDGAEVLIDGKKSGQSTSGGVLRLRLDPGSYRVEVEKNGYLPVRPEQVRIRKNEETTATFNLTASPIMAVITIKGAMPNVQVLADGHHLGLTASDGSFSHDLIPGHHDIVLSQSGRTSNAFSGNFVAGKSSPLDGTAFNFPESARSLALAVLRNLPPGASIKVDGRDAYRADNSGFAQLEIPVGDHTLELTKDGYKTKTLQRPFGTGQTMVDGSMEQTPETLEAQDWKQASSANEPKQVEDYLAKHPGSSHVVEAESRLRDLIWGTTNRDDVAALQAYMKRFPDGRNSLEASRLVEDIFWNKLDKKDPQALREFLSRYPNSAHVPQVRLILDQFARQDTEKKAINDALDLFNSAFEHQQPRELKQIWPGATDQYLSALHPPAGYKVILTLHPSADPAIFGDTALVACYAKSKTTKPGGQVTENQKQINVHLRKSGGGWLISGLSQQ